MNKNLKTIETEDKYCVPFFNKMQISIERGDGIYVFDENEKKYIDLTSGWGVTCIGHANPVITNALIEQSKKIIQNPESGKTYSPSRAKLLQLLSDVLPHKLNKIFFTNSGAEANDAVIKLARKVSGKKNVISTINSFHGRTISTASATGQSYHRDKYSPLMPNYLFVPYNNVEEVNKIIKNDIAAIIVEPIQGEGGIIVPSKNYLLELSDLCKENGVFLILDEIQTGFLRTGSFYCSSPLDLKVDFMTMAKGLAGGFPLGAFAVSEEVSQKIDIGDHGGTYCGNPLGCAVSYAVTKYLIDNNVEQNVNEVSLRAFEFLYDLQKEFPDVITDVRGKGLLLALELSSDKIALYVQKDCMENGLLINVTHGNIIRIFPALTITKKEMDESLTILKKSLVKYKKTMHNKSYVF